MSSQTGSLNNISSTVFGNTTVSMPSPTTVVVTNTVGEVITEVITYCPETDHHGNVGTSTSSYIIGTSRVSQDTITTKIVEDNITKTAIVYCETTTDSKGQASTKTVTVCPECTSINSKSGSKSTETVTATTKPVVNVSNGVTSTTFITEYVTVKSGIPTTSSTPGGKSDVQQAKIATTTTTLTSKQQQDSSIKIQSQSGTVKPQVEQQVSASAAKQQHSSVVVSQYAGSAASLNGLGPIGTLVTLLVLMLIN